MADAAGTPGPRARTENLNQMPPLRLSRAAVPAVPAMPCRPGPVPARADSHFALPPAGSGLIRPSLGQ